jgi:hypothetical protein
LKRIWLGVAAGLVGLGILSGVAAAVTVHFLYQPGPASSPAPTAAAALGATTGSGPKAASESAMPQAQTTTNPTAATAPSNQSTNTHSNNTQPGGTPPANAQPGNAQPGSIPSAASQPAAPLPGGTSLTEGALALVRDLPNQGQMILPSLTKLAPQPLRASPLPGATDRTGTILVWTTYTRPDGTPGSGPLLVQFQDGRPKSITGPLVPPGGYTRPTFTLLDEQSRRLPAAAYQGKPLLLIAPRRPEAGLGYLLTSLHQALAPHGVTVALVIDVGAPDWIAAARKEGFTGPVWRLKGQLDQIPVVTPGLLEGAAGLLIDPDGYAVGSLTLLDPTAYDLFDKEPAQIAVQVLTAWGLIRAGE